MKRTHKAVFAALSLAVAAAGWGVARGPGDAIELAPQSSALAPQPPAPGPIERAAADTGGARDGSSPVNQLETAPRAEQASRAEDGGKVLTGGPGVAAPVREAVPAGYENVKAWIQRNTDLEAARPGARADTPGGLVVMLPDPRRKKTNDLSRRALPPPQSQSSLAAGVKEAPVDAQALVLESREPVPQGYENVKTWILRNTEWEGEARGGAGALGAPDPKGDGASSDLGWWPGKLGWAGVFIFGGGGLAALGRNRRRERSEELQTEIEGLLESSARREWDKKYPDA